VPVQDGGPIYCETPATPGWLAEPWNTVSELAFLLVAVHWAWRLRGRYGRHVFVMACLPVMVVAFVGGVLFHGTRSSRVWLLLDIRPMVGLFVAAVLYVTWRVTRRLWVAALYAILFWFALRGAFSLGLPHTTAITLSYGVATLFIALPLLREVARAGGRGGRDIACALALVAAGAVANLADRKACGLLPMGMHWLWHVCAAGGVHFLLRYLTADPVLVPPGTPAGAR